MILKLSPLMMILWHRTRTNYRPVCNVWDFWKGKFCPKCINRLCFGEMKFWEKLRYIHNINELIWRFWKSWRKSELVISRNRVRGAPHSQCFIQFRLLVLASKWSPNLRCQGIRSSFICTLPVSVRTRYSKTTSEHKIS